MFPKLRARASQCTSKSHTKNWGTCSFNRQMKAKSKDNRKNYISQIRTYIMCQYSVMKPCELVSRNWRFKKDLDYIWSSWLTQKDMARIKACNYNQLRTAIQQLDIGTWQTFEPCIASLKIPLPSLTEQCFSSNTTRKLLISWEKKYESQVNLRLIKIYAKAT